MRAENVSFRSHEGADVCQIELQDGTVGVFPANEVIVGSVPAITYASLYREAFIDYKNGEVKPVPVAQMTAVDRDAELESLRAQVASLEGENTKLRGGGRKAKRKPAPAKAPAKKAAKKPAAKKAAKAKKK